MSVKSHEVAGLLERQQFCCALTGRALVPEAAALDHVIPVSRGGLHDIGNAQILDKAVNRAKGALTNEEFVQMCREVAAYAKAG